MKQLARAIARYAPDLALVAGAAAITFGAGMIFVPAGFIVGGLLTIAGVALFAMGGGDSA